MEQGFIKADSSNLPRIDTIMLGAFLSSNKDFCSAEFRNVKTSISSRPSYGDDAICYVQLKRDGKICTVKCKICPEHKVHGKLYAVTLIVDEEEEEVTSVQCHDCVASQGGCKHAIAFLMWVHRRSEEPACTSVECYWAKSKLSRVGISLKYITSKDLSQGSLTFPSNSRVLERFLEECEKKKIQNCELLKYQHTYSCDDIESMSMHQLVLTYNEKCCDTFLDKILLTDYIISKVEEKTRDQSQSRIWHELRYGRITASRAFEFSRCKVWDGTLLSLIMGGKIPDTPAMKRGRTLEDNVRITVGMKLGKEIKKCGLMLSKSFPMIAGSPDGICSDSVIEIKCPMSSKSYQNYIKNGQPTKKYYAQMQIQMYLARVNSCYFCVADYDYSSNKNVDIVLVKFDESYVSDFLKVLVSLWKTNVYPLLYQSIQ